LAYFYPTPRELGLRLEFKTKVKLADGRVIDAWYATAYVEVMGRET